MSSYWDKVLDQRIGRRRALIATGGMAGAAALLAACGGGSDGGSSSGEKDSGLISQPKDTTAQAKRGGVLKSNIDSEPQTFDPMFADRGSAQRNSRMQSRLLELKPGVGGPASGEVIGDLAQSWEISGDGTQITVKLVGNAHFDPREPTNGRVVDANDVIWSWNRFVKTGTLRADYQAITSMTAPDKNTIVIKLTEPQAGVLTQLTASSGGTFLVMPVEAEDKYNPVKDSRSAGPYLLWEHTPSVRSVYKKNPGFHRDYGYADTMEFPIVTENATALAAFRSGQIYVRSSFPALDILPAKRDLPQLQLLLGDANGNIVTGNTVRTMFGWEESGGKNAPFKDVRVRQAFSMAQDRDLFIEAVYNVSKFASEGVDLQTRWNTAVNASDDVWWFDPQSKEFGENGKYYQHNVAEAKSLLAAAGYKDGVDTLAHYITTSEYGLDFQKWIEITLNMASEAGIRTKNDPPGYTQDWRPKYADAKGKHDGVAFRIDTGPPDTGDRLGAHYNTTGSLFGGFTPDGKSGGAGDPQMEDLTLKMRREFDLKKRLEYGKQLQQYEAKMQYWPFFAGGASSLQLAWPVLRNFGVYSGGRDPLVYMWIDETQPPLKS